MKRIALVSSEPVRPTMAGIGIRYLEFARRLPALAAERGKGDLSIRLISPAPEAETLAALGGGGTASAASVVGAEGEGSTAIEVRSLAAGSALATHLEGCDAAVAQGQLANDVVLARPDLPTAIDLYDPWLVENLSYAATLGLGPYRNDHASWVLQMSRGDFFLCSSLEQRNFYLGFLAAVGRLHPERVAADPDLSRLIAPVPFGVPAELPPLDPYLDAILGPRARGERRLLFGGLYDWYDPWTLLDAFERLDRPAWKLLLIANPNPESTPQRRMAEVEKRARARGLWGTRIVRLDWVPAERRFDLLREVDALVAPHLPSLETALSLRTRFLDAAAAGTPMIATEGGAMSRLLAEHNAGLAVPPGDAVALAAALVELCEGTGGGALRAGARSLAASFAWEVTLAPLVDFCLTPRRDESKERFAAPLPTHAPRASFGRRVARRARRLLASWQARARP